MKGRPEILWPLFGDLEKLPGIGPKSASNFKHLNVEKPRDLIFTLPTGGIDRRPVSSITGSSVSWASATVRPTSPPGGVARSPSPVVCAVWARARGQS